MYLVNDDKSNLERIITALAANSDSLDSTDYIMMDINELDVLGIQKSEAPGQTLDSEVNTCHMDLLDLTGSQLNSLAHAFRDKGESDRFYKNDLKQMILEAIRVGNIDQNMDKFREGAKFWR